MILDISVVIFCISGELLVIFYRQLAKDVFSSCIYKRILPLLIHFNSAVGRNCFFEESIFYHFVGQLYPLVLLFAVLR